MDPAHFPLGPPLPNTYKFTGCRGSLPSRCTILILPDPTLPRVAAAIMILPTGQDEISYMIYEPDGRTLRAYFEMVNGRMAKAEESTTPDLIPGEYPSVSTCFTTDACHTKSTGISKLTTRLAKSKKLRYIRKLL